MFHSDSDGRDQIICQLFRNPRDLSSQGLPLFVLPVGITLLLMLAGLRLRRRALIWSGSSLDMQHEVRQQACR